MTYEHLEVERHGPVGWLINNRPEQLNAMNSKMRDEFGDAWNELNEDPAVRVIGIDVDAHPEAVTAEVRRLAGEVWSRLGLPGSFPADKVVLEPDYAGEAYGLPTAQMKAAVQRAARLEGLLLDPVYSGKAMAGLIGLVERGAFSPDDTVVFLHTGGTPALFPYRAALED